MEEWKVKLLVYEGPLDLLLHLLDQNKVNIYDIPIARITDQYMDYLRSVQKQQDPDREETRIYDMDLLSEFLLTAATLLEIKAKMLLPKEEKKDEEQKDPREELVRQLLQYRRYKEAAKVLKERQEQASRRMYHKPSIPEEVSGYVSPPDPEALLADVAVSRLGAAFSEVMKRQNERIDPIRFGFGRIQKEEITLEERTVWLKNYAAAHRTFSFRELLQKQKSRQTLIVTFLAVLELMKDGVIRATQETPFSDIQIRFKEEEA